jgi:NADPH-dependent 2,4-dienoyl-CoA reductase/sulfur reductase-like enzyme
MAERAFKYVIVGGGLAGASAVKGIRERDTQGSVLLIGAEKHMPYDRPPLSKKLWFGKTTVEKIVMLDQGYCEQNGVEVALGAQVVAVDAAGKKLTTSGGEVYSYGKLLLATGGEPRRLTIPGGDLEGICYYRYLDDYLRVREQAAEGKSAVVVGGGFIGSEMAAALSINKVEVTMVFPSPYLVNRVFPEYLGKAIQRHYVEEGVQVLAREKPASFEERGGKFVTKTESGRQIESDMVIVGVGIAPEVKLAQAAGLQAGNGIVVNERLETSHPNIYAAGDNAFFPYYALGKQTRVEHWDNAINQGKWAGRNMAGAHEPFTYMPYFYSDLFEFGYEAVGEVDASLETVTDWQKENEKGVIYYLREGKVRGAMMCDVWDKVDAARELILAGEWADAQSVQGLIR